MDNTSKGKFLMIRATEEDKVVAQRLSDVYGVSVSEIVRFAMRYIDMHRPDMSITHVIKPGKVSAPVGAIAALN